MEFVKNCIRYVLFWLPMDGEFRAETGTLKYRFLDWLYGNGEPEFPVIWPDEEERRGKG